MNTTNKRKHHWYLLLSPGGKWTPFKLPSLTFLETYGREFEYRGPFEDMARALAALNHDED